MPVAPARRCPGCQRLTVGQCLSCDNATAHASGRVHPNATLVTGPPCAGKNTYVGQHAGPGDLVVDLDALMVALTGRPTYDHDERLKPYAFAARDAVLAAFWQGLAPVPHAWIILSAPSEHQRAPYRQRVGTVVLVTASRATLRARAEVERPPEWLGYIDRWLSQADRGGVDRVVDTSAASPRPRAAAPQIATQRR